MDRFFFCLDTCRTVNENMFYMKLFSRKKCKINVIFYSIMVDSYFLYS